MVDKLVRYLDSDYRYPRGQYVDKKKQNAEATLEMARKRVRELNIQHVVVASYTGRTALKVALAS